MDLSKPPKTADLPAFKLPDVFEARLANGMEVLLIEQPRFPLATVRLGFHAGSKFDSVELAGLAETTAALLTEGTEERSAREIAEEMAWIGGSLRADASPDAFVIAGNCLAENLPRLVSVIAEVAARATFPPEEVQLRKQNRTQELLAQRSDAGFLADEKFTGVVFNPHPYGRQDPSPESIARISREALVRFRDEHLAPNNAVLVVLGALPARAQVLKLIEAQFGGWVSKQTPTAPPASFPAPKRNIVLVDRPGSVQADIRIGRLAVNRASPHYFPLLVGNTILGGGTSSRIFANIRERHGFAYDARSVLQPLKDAGVHSAVTQVRNEVLEPALEGLLREMTAISTGPVSAEELSTAQNYLSGVFVMRLETQDSLASQLAALKLMGLPIDYLEKYAASVRAVEPGQIRESAGEYIHPGRASIVVVGDAAEIGKQLESFGTVTVEKAEP
jgi:predicted Zn-dependent peptidase